MHREEEIQQAHRGISPTGATGVEAIQLDDIAAQLMTVQRYWNAPNRQIHLLAALEATRAAWHDIQAELAQGTLPLPLDVQHNLLILSVYADSKITACEAEPSADALGSLVALTRTLASSLREWREAA